jgi:uncharacterized protein YqcC (DUF446 family)
MMETDNNIASKIKELELEMKAIGLWQKEVPEWVNDFEEKVLYNGKDFAQWLQYIFMPNHINRSTHLPITKEKKMIVPAAIKFFGDDVQKGKLLQILIEIDSLL